MAVGTSSIMYRTLTSDIALVSCFVFGSGSSGRGLAMEQRQVLSEARSGLRRQLSERCHELVGPSRAEAPSPGLKILQHLVDPSDPSRGFDLAPPSHHFVHQADVVQGGAIRRVRGRGLHEVSAGPCDPFAGPPLLLLRQIAVLG